MNAPTYASSYNPMASSSLSAVEDDDVLFWVPKVSETDEPFEAFGSDTTPPPSTSSIPAFNRPPQKPLPHQLPPKKRFLNKSGSAHEQGALSSDPLLLRHGTIVTTTSPQQKPLAHQLPPKKRFCHHHELSPQQQQQQQQQQEHPQHYSFETISYRRTYKLLDDFSIFGNDDDDNNNDISYGVGWPSEHSVSSSLCSDDDDDFWGDENKSNTTSTKKSSSLSSSSVAPPVADGKDDALVESTRRQEEEEEEGEEDAPSLICSLHMLDGSCDKPTPKDRPDTVV